MAQQREPFADLVWRALSSMGATPTTFYRPLPFLTLAAQLRWWHKLSPQVLLNVVLPAVLENAARRNGEAAGRLAT